MVNRDLTAKVKSSKKRVCFRLDEPGAASVAVAGDFNQWDQKSHCLKRKSNGMWEKIIFLTPGSYEYKFLVDGQWRMDPGNSSACMNQYGTRNNVLIVPQG